MKRRSWDDDDDDGGAAAPAGPSVFTGDALLLSLLCDECCGSETTRNSRSRHAPVVTAARRADGDRADSRSRSRCMTWCCMYWNSGVVSDITANTTRLTPHCAPDMMSAIAGAALCAGGHVAEAASASTLHTADSAAATFSSTMKLACTSSFCICTAVDLTIIFSRHRPWSTSRLDCSVAKFRSRRFFCFRICLSIVVRPSCMSASKSLHVHEQNTSL